MAMYPLQQLSPDLKPKYHK